MSMARHRLYDCKTDVYRAYDAEGYLLYVGASVNVFRRLRQHKYAPWIPRTNEICVEQYANRREAAYVEAVAIRDEMPIYNIQPSRRPLYMGITEAPEFIDAFHLWPDEEGNWWIDD